MTTQPIDEKVKKFTVDGEDMRAVVRYFATPEQIKDSGVNVGFDVQISEKFVQFVSVGITIKGYNNFVNLNREVSAIHAQLKGLGAVWSMINGSGAAWSMNFARQSYPETNVTIGLLGYHVEAANSLMGPEDTVPKRMTLWLGNEEQRQSALESRIDSDPLLANTGRPVGFVDSLVSVDYAGSFNQRTFSRESTHQLSDELR